MRPGYSHGGSVRRIPVPEEHDGPDRCAVSEMTNRPFLALLSLAALSSPAGPASAVADPPAPGSADRCATLIAPEGVVFSVVPEWVESAALPKYCRAAGTIDGYVQFEIRLPAEWSGRFLMAGCGGFCGELLPDKPGRGNSINGELRRGYAVISHDGGHRAKSWEAHWAADRKALALWAHEVLPVVAGAGTRLATSLYGQPPRYRYFSGCSNGGRLGLMAAQRYPELFDGIAAGGSIFDLSGIAGLWGNWLILSNQAGAASRFPQAKVPLLEKLVMNQCDALDGLADGVIDHPGRCRPDLSAAACAADAATTETCLTGEEIAVLGRLYGGVRNGRGEVVYPALVYGSEHYSDTWLFGTDGRPAWGVLASASYRRLLALDLSEQDAPDGLPTDRMLDWISRSAVPELSDAKDPDLSGLREAGGKLLIYQGWSDPLIIPEPVVRYYERAAEAAGGLEKLKEFARLFMVPGWGHCWEEPANAPDDFDPVLALERWVEQGREPDYIVARQLDAAGAKRRSRPVCSYPGTARLEAGQDPADHRSYRCAGEADPTRSAVN